MSNAWEEIQAIKIKRNSLREKLQKRKKERQDILNLSSSSEGAVVPTLNKVLSADSVTCCSVQSPIASRIYDEEENSVDSLKASAAEPYDLETALLSVLCDVALLLPVSADELCSTVGRRLSRNPGIDSVVNLLQKFSTQQLISLRDNTKDGLASVDVVSGEHAKLVAMMHEVSNENDASAAAAATSPPSGGVAAAAVGGGGGTVVPTSTAPNTAVGCDSGCQTAPNFDQPSASSSSGLDQGELKRKNESDGNFDADCQPQVKTSKMADSEEKKREKKTTDIMSLLSMPSIREKETKKVGEEILELLSKPTAKERSLAERFRSNGAQVMEFCPHGTRADCGRESGGRSTCSKLHFKKIIQKHTDDSLGDCSFLNTCFHMDTCKYVHYEVDGSTVPAKSGCGANSDAGGAAGVCVRKEDGAKAMGEKTILYPPQWIQCDLRYLDMTVLGKFAVVMADPPWDIHMELPYGTMSDDEMRQLGVPALQDDGVIFLWVTGRAMELGRECLQLWGYERVDEIIWVKTNQLQRIIRTGRTGHWLNHGKEHCLVGKKGSVEQLNRGLDCDVIVAEVRATSHKPDEIYGIIERLSPGTRKIELFGRPHNVQPNWITLGNQVNGVRLVDPDLIQAFRKRYPDGNCMAPPKT